MQNSVAIIGGGLMGAGIAAKFALAEYATLVVETNSQRIARIGPLVEEILSELIEAGSVSAERCQQALLRIESTAEFEKVASVGLVIEAVPEVLGIKHEVYEKLEALVAIDTLIASNTSGLLPDALCANMKTPQRFLIAHFWNPPHMVPLVEVVPTAKTAATALEKMVDILRRIEAEPVVLKTAIPGFIGNRLQFAVLREALHIVRSGAADAQTVDAVMKASLGRRYSIIGPLEGADLGGLGTFLTIASHLMPALAKDEDVLEVLREQVEHGNLGAASGHGFYEWDAQRLASIKSRRMQVLKSHRQTGPTLGLDAGTKF